MNSSIPYPMPWHFQAALTSRLIVQAAAWSHACSLLARRHNSIYHFAQAFWLQPQNLIRYPRTECAFEVRPWTDYQPASDAQLGIHPFIQVVVPCAYYSKVSYFTSVLWVARVFPKERWMTPAISRLWLSSRELWLRLMLRSNLLWC